MKSPRAVAVTALLVLAACAADDHVGDVEETIAKVLAERLEQPAGTIAVACPEDAELEAGSALECDVTVGADDAVPVALTIGEGGTARLAAAVIPTKSAADYLAGELSGPAEGAVEVSCGDTVMVVRQVGDTFACEAVRSADGAAFTVTVEVAAVDGTVRYEVTSTTMTTASSAPPAGSTP